MASKLQEGAVELILGGDTCLLQPTLRAALEISRRYKGFHNAEVALVVRELDAYVAVIMAGLNLPAAERAEIERKVYAAGLVAPPRESNPALLDPLLTYLTVLQNGGRSLPEADDPPGEPAAG